ncbi:MAG: histidine kinase [Dermatophilus congolensis]|nr:histidine kinase [Dermatophilus congolensis]
MTDCRLRGPRLWGPGVVARPHLVHRLGRGPGWSRRFAELASRVGYGGGATLSVGPVSMVVMGDTTSARGSQAIPSTSGAADARSSSVDSPTLEPRIDPVLAAMAAVVLAVFAVRFAVAGPVPEALVDVQHHAGRMALAASAVLAAAVLLWARSSPVVAVLLTCCAGVFWTLAGYPGPGAVLPTAFTAIGLSRPRPRSIATSVATYIAAAVVLTAAHVVLNLRGLAHDTSTISALLLALGAAMGLWLRSRRQLLAGYEERAARAEAAMEAEAQRRVAEDRLAVARDLHDVVAHHLSVVNVQSGVAKLLLTRDHEGAEAALDLVQDSSRTALHELGSVLSVLRSGAALTPPAVSHSLAGLTALVADARAVGLDVTLDLQPFDLRDDEVELVAYRVVQESLTNAGKHAPGSVCRVGVRLLDNANLQVVVENGPPAGGDRPGAHRPDPVPGGYGITGMAERVERIRGTFACGPTPEGGFVVTAVLPISTAPERHDAQDAQEDSR